jgi:tetratricopeptide (TPR) repeat protein
MSVRISLVDLCKVWIFLGVLLVVTAIGGWWYSGSDQRMHRQIDRAWNALDSGNFTAATTLLNDLRRDPRYSRQAQLLRAAVLIRGGDAARGLRELERIPLDQELAERQQLLACEALHRLKRWTEAAALAHQILELPQHGSQAHRWLAIIYFDLGSMSQAEEHLLELAKREPHDFSPYRLLGQIHWDFEQYREAIEDFRNALRRNPPTELVPELQLGLAKALMKQNDFHNALAALQHASLENNLEAQALLAECLWVVGQKAEAENRLATLLERHADSPEVLWPAARIALFNEQTTQASHLLTKIVRIAPFDHQALMELSSLHRRLGQIEIADDYLARRNAAYDLLKKMVELNKRAIEELTNAEVREELAIICQQLGKPELAKVWKEAASALRNEVRQPH